MRKAHALGALTFAMTVAIAHQVCAQPTEKERKYGYEFKDDLLQGGSLAGQVAQIHVVQKGRRDMLIRPRTQFVTEMLKSVENL